MAAVSPLGRPLGFNIIFSEIRKSYTFELTFVNMDYFSTKKKMK